MRHNANSMSKLVAGNSAYRCLSWWSEANRWGYRPGGFSIGIEHVILQGKKVWVPDFKTFKITGADAIRQHFKKHDGGKCYMWGSKKYGGSYHLSSGSLEGTACFSTMKEAKRFVADKTQNIDMEIVEECLRRLDYDHVVIDGDIYVDAASRDNNCGFGDYDYETDSYVPRERIPSRWCYFHNGQRVNGVVLNRIEEHFETMKHENAIWMYEHCLTSDFLNYCDDDRVAQIENSYALALAYFKLPVTNIKPLREKEEKDGPNDADVCSSPEPGEDSGRPDAVDGSTDKGATIPA